MRKQKEKYTKFHFLRDENMFLLYNKLYPDHFEALNVKRKTLSGALAIFCDRVAIHFPLIGEFFRPKGRIYRCRDI